LPRRRNFVPLRTPAGTSTVTSPSIVGTVTRVPRAASVMLIGSSLVISSPWRVSQGSGFTLIVIRRSPGSPPKRPGSPPPLITFSAPASVAGGSRTLNVRVWRRRPTPLQPSHGSTCSSPVPSQRPQRVHGANRPSPFTSPRPVHTEQVSGGLPPGRVPVPLQSVHGPPASNSISCELPSTASRRLTVRV